MKTYCSILNENGSVRHGCVLILVMIILITVFYFIDKKEQETRDFGFSRDPDRFDETREKPFFNDDDFVGQSRSRQAYQPVLKPIDEDVKEEDPNMVGKSTSNTFYQPPSPEKRRELESKSNTPKLRP